MPSPKYNQVNRTFNETTEPTLDNNFNLPRTGKELTLYKLKKRLKNHQILNLTEDQLLFTAGTTSHEIMGTVQTMADGDNQDLHPY